MRISFNRRFKHKAVIDITPLIDLVFLLVAFFMVTSSLGSESSITVNLPRAHESGEYKHGTMTVTITKDDNFFINDKEIKKNNLKKEFEKLSKAGKDLTVIIRGDRKSSYNSMIYIIDKLNSAGIPKFVISTIK